MKFDYIEHTISTHYLSALINDDESGLTDDDVELLYQWIKDNPSPSGHFNIWDAQAETENFNFCEVCNLYSETCIIRQYFPINNGA